MEKKPVCPTERVEVREVLADCDNASTRSKAVDGIGATQNARVILRGLAPYPISPMNLRAGMNRSIYHGRDMFFTARSNKCYLRHHGREMRNLRKSDKFVHPLLPSRCGSESKQNLGGMA